jgi:hypothetical protein
MRRGGLDGAILSSDMADGKLVCGGACGGRLSGRGPGQEWRKRPEELIGEGPVRRPVAGETALA